MSSTPQLQPGFVLLFASGLPGDDVDPLNPLARASRRLLDDGQRTVAAIPAILRAAGGDPFWLGFFALTEAGRVLFFPGLANRLEDMTGGLSDGRGRFARKLQFDHISLEADRRTWHMTDEAGRSRQGGGRTRDLGAGRALWFCATASSIADLRPVKARTFVPYRGVSNGREAQARSDQFLACVSNGASSSIPLQPRPNADSVLHVAVSLGDPGAPPYDGDRMPFPYAAPGVERIALPPGTKGAFGRLLLSAALELQILVAWVPGKAAPGALTLTFTFAWDDSAADPT